MGHTGGGNNSMTPELFVFLCVVLFSYVLVFFVGLAVGYKEGLKDLSEEHEYPKEIKQC